MAIDYDFYEFREYDPDELRLIYESGFRGTVGDGVDTLRSAALASDFYADYPEARNAGRNRLILPYLYAMAFDPDFGRAEAQTTGDCVSHSGRWAATIHLSSDAYIGWTRYPGRLATEANYGDRGHAGQGANCGRLATWFGPSGVGGCLPRGRYEWAGGSVDLSRYNSRIGHNWGRTGTPAGLRAIAAQNKAMRVYRATSLQMAVDALALGFGLSVCSGFGFANQRNQHGLAEQRGSWAHAMAWVGVDATEWAQSNYGGPLFLVQNSWGVWNRGPKRYDQPDGSFFIRPAVASRMISGAYVIGSVRGVDREVDYGQGVEIVRDRVDRLCHGVRSARSRATVRGYGPGLSGSRAAAGGSVGSTGSTAG